MFFFLSVGDGTKRPGNLADGFLEIWCGLTVMYGVGLETYTKNIWTRLASNRTYGVAPKGLVTFLGRFYKEVAKTASGTSVCPFERQTARKKKIPSKNTVSLT